MMERCNNDQLPALSITAGLHIPKQISVGNLVNRSHQRVNYEVFRRVLEVKDFKSLPLLLLNHRVNNTTGTGSFQYIRCAK